MSELRRPSHQQSRVGQLLRRHSFEILWPIVVALGMFLVLERLSIRAMLIRWAQEGAASLSHSMGNVNEARLALVARVTLSDAMGFVLIAGALVALLYRVRWRLLRSPALTIIKCPRCNGVIHRVHRHRGDRLVSWFVPVHRYRCASRKCRWSGLRIATGEHWDQGNAPVVQSPGAATRARTG